MQISARSLNFQARLPSLESFVRPTSPAAASDGGENDQVEKQLRGQQRCGQRTQVDDMDRNIVFTYFAIYISTW